VTKRLLFLCLPLLTACDDGLGPAFWSDLPDTLVIHSASRTEYVGLVSAVDITADPVTPLPIEVAGLTNNWDFTLVDQGGTLALAPSAIVPGGTTSRARVMMVLGQTLESITEAPRDTTMFFASPVVLRADAVYIIRSRRSSCGFSTGVRYAKLKPVEINVPRGTLRFAIVRNPYCDDRALVPPEE
jgi:hypothetical protein